MRAVGVVVPAHDEQELLGACLSALHTAADAVGVDVHLLVVLDSCTDESLEVCGSTPTLEVQLRSAGRARAAGFDALLSGLGTDGVWLATTDADSRVAPDWLVQQLALAADGADAVFGIVEVDDWSEHPAHTAAAFADLYASAAEHPHRHGACLGLRADRYLQVGGMPPLHLGEDEALAARLEELPGVRLVASTAVRVTTSARVTSRVDGGFATLLASLGAA